MKKNILCFIFFAMIFNLNSLDYSTLSISNVLKELGEPERIDISYTEDALKNTYKNMFSDCKDYYIYNSYMNTLSFKISDFGISVKYVIDDLIKNCFIDYIFIGNGIRYSLKEKKILFIDFLSNSRLEYPLNLKYGMTIEEVKKILGEPKTTAGTYELPMFVYNNKSDVIKFVIISFKDQKIISMRVSTNDIDVVLNEK